MIIRAENTMPYKTLKNASKKIFLKFEIMHQTNAVNYFFISLNFEINNEFNNYKIKCVVSFIVITYT